MNKHVFHSSTMTTWGREGESGAARQMLESFPTGVVSIVSDSYNLWDFIDKIIAKDLRDVIESRDGVLVVRPDSGPPTETLVKVKIIPRLCRFCRCEHHAFECSRPYTCM